VFFHSSRRFRWRRSPARLTAQKRLSFPDRRHRLTCALARIRLTTKSGCFWLGSASRRKDSHQGRLGAGRVSGGARGRGLGLVGLYRDCSAGGVANHRTAAQPDPLITVTVDPTLAARFIVTTEPLVCPHLRRRAVEYPHIYRAEWIGRWHLPMVSSLWPGRVGVLFGLVAFFQGK